MNLVVHSNTYRQNKADSVSHSIINITVYFLSEKFKTSPVILGKQRHVHLFIKQSEGSTGADDSNFGPKQGGGDSEQTLSKLPNKKSKQTLAGLKAASLERI